MFTVCMKINPEQRKELCEHLAMNGYACRDHWISDDCIEVDDEEIYEIHTILSDRDIEYFVKRYYVCGISYDKNNCVTDYEKYFDDFDTYEEAYELFVKLQCRSAESFFTAVPEVYQWLIQLEECEETEDEINCIDVRNEWWIVNPNYQEVK